MSIVLLACSFLISAGLIDRRSIARREDRDLQCLNHAQSFSLPSWRARDCATLMGSLHNFLALEYGTNRLWYYEYRAQNGRQTQNPKPLDLPFRYQHKSCVLSVAPLNYFSHAQLPNIDFTHRRLADLRIPVHIFHAAIEGIFRQCVIRDGRLSFSGLRIFYDDEDKNYPIACIFMFPAHSHADNILHGSRVHNQAATPVITAPRSIPPAPEQPVRPRIFRSLAANGSC